VATEDIFNPELRNSNKPQIPPIPQIINYRTCRTLGRGFGSSVENNYIRAHPALRASFSLPSFLPIAYGQQSGTLRLRSPRFADTPHADTPERRFIVVAASPRCDPLCQNLRHQTKGRSQQKDAKITKVQWQRMPGKSGFRIAACNADLEQLSEAALLRGNLTRAMAREISRLNPSSYLLAISLIGFTEAIDKQPFLEWNLPEINHQKKESRRDQKIK
jgi:hypothetical protein